MLLSYIKKIKQHAKKRSQKGFTLLETLVAIFLLTLALTGPIYIATLALRSSIESRDSISAYYLAEEVVEVIRNNRDTRSLNRDANLDGSDWLKNVDPNTGSVTSPANCFNSSGSTDNICTMSRDASTRMYVFEPCVSGECSPLSFNADASQGIIYGDVNGGETESKFTREFYIESGFQDPNAGTDNPLREAKIVVTIRWQDKGRDKQFQLVEYLYNLQYLDYEH